MGRKKEKPSQNREGLPDRLFNRLERVRRSPLLQYSDRGKARFGETIALVLYVERGIVNIMLG